MLSIIATLLKEQNILIVIHKNKTFSDNRCTCLDFVLVDSLVLSKVSRHISMVLLFEPGFEIKLLLKTIDGTIQVRSNVDPTFYLFVGSGRSRGTAMNYLLTADLGSASIGK